MFSLVSGLQLGGGRLGHTGSPCSTSFGIACFPRWLHHFGFSAAADKPRSRYAVNNTGDHADDQDGDSRFSDVILATILATKSEMCGQKFELKIDNVRFVGHPTLLQHALGQVSKTDPSPKREAPTMILFNVVFALRANADPSVINCLHNLSRRIATVLQHEERRCQYLTREAKLILALQDEVSAVADGECGRNLSYPTPQHRQAAFGGGTLVQVCRGGN
eukprot:XP_013967578.2 GATOR complex protein NPRL3-like isoform X2 [Canis lupus familiaris]